MQIIAVSNPKGGSGKTTTAINLAAALAETGQRVLLVDLDPQGHTTLGLGYAPEDFEHTVYHVTVNEAAPASAIVAGVHTDRLDLLPSDDRLTGVEAALDSLKGKELILGEQLHTVSKSYDTCLIDCAPSHGLRGTTALVASTQVLVPVQARSYAFGGLARLLSTIEQARARFRPCSALLLGFVLTLVEGRTLLSRQTERDLRTAYGPLVLETIIHKTVALAEAPSTGKSVLAYAPKSKAAAEYRALGREVVARLQLPQTLTIPASKSSFDSHLHRRPASRRQRRVNRKA